MYEGDDSSDDDEIDMQKYIRPVRKMLGDYRKTIDSLKNSNQLEEAPSHNKENLRTENYTQPTKRMGRHYENASVEELDN